MKNFLIALQFLTILPIKIKSDIKEKDFGRSIAYFPIVGMLIGLTLAASSFLFSFLPHPVAAAVILGISAAITGGIHLDGLADTSDGFYGGKTKEKILEIMRDSRIGTMGTIGVVLLLLLKFALLYSIPPNLLWKALIIAPVLARYAQVLACSLSGYAREDGKAKFFIEYASKRELILSVIFTSALSIFLMRAAGAVSFILSTAVILSLIWYVKNRIGGMTGDTIGAISEIVETAALFIALFYSEIECF